MSSSRSDGWCARRSPTSCVTPARMSARSPSAPDGSRSSTTVAGPRRPPVPAPGSPACASGWPTSAGRSPPTAPGGAGGYGRNCPRWEPTVTASTPEPARVRLLLADDQALIRSALAALLELEEDFEVVAQAARGDEVVAAALAARPDVALLDIEMPGLDGLAAAAALTQQVPSCRVLILTTFGRPGYL